MLPGNEPPQGIPFSACDLAHIWPAEMGRQADEIAAELRLPEGFFTELDASAIFFKVTPLVAAQMAVLAPLKQAIARLNF
jgi:hypothetical protein